MKYTIITLLFTKIRVSKILFLLFILLISCKEDNKRDDVSFSPSDLDVQFCDPPSSASPHVFWHWMNGNITKEGIRADLEDMKRVGIGGVMLFDGGLYIPDGPIRYGSEEWYDHVQYAIECAAELGIKFGIMNCPGWATAGGPWISPEQSMKMLVWEKVFVGGGKLWKGKIGTPPSNLNFYKDIAVIAVKERNDPIVAEEKVNGTEITFSFPNPIESRSLTIPANKNTEYQGVVEVSNDGEKYKAIYNFNFTSKNWLMPMDISFPVTVATHFRLKLTSGILKGKVTLSNCDKINQLPSEQGFHSYDQNTFKENIEPIDQFINISDLMQPDGSLEWNVPEGKWTIIRLGYTTTGATNHPAAKEGTGLEVDKFDNEAIEYHFNKSLGRIINDSHAYLGKTFSTVVFDSWEAENQNWTKTMPNLFKERKGYNLEDYLVCLTGYYVNSKKETDAFMRDFRSVLADLYGDVFFGTMSDLAEDKGLQIFAEPYGGIIDKFKIASNIDILATEFWNHDLYKGFGAAVSVSHTTGRNIIMAEAFTSRPPYQSRWIEIPSNMKSRGDIAYTAGINLFALHSYVHQPRVDVFPGFTLGRYGTHFGRGNSWWPLADGWIDYLRRCQYLLQYGAPVADFLFLVPEELSREKRDLNYPWERGYKGDYLSVIQLEKLDVKDGLIMTEGGNSYKTLFLPVRWRATLETLSLLKRLDKKGATIIGIPPFEAEGLLDIKQNHKKWKTAIDNWPFNRPITQKEIVSPDFTADNRLLFTHRADNNLDIYFIVNPTNEIITDQIRFRITGKEPELWDPVSGERLNTPSYSIGNDMTNIDISLTATESVFVIFRNDAKLKKYNAPRLTEYKEEFLEGIWTVNFEEKEVLPNKLS